MRPNNFEQKKTTFYFQEKDLYRVDLDTLNRLWPIINKEPIKPRQPKDTCLALPELHQLEMALILIRQGYIHLSIDEEKERLSIILKVLGESKKINPVSFNKKPNHLIK